MGDVEVKSIAVGPFEPPYMLSSWLLFPPGSSELLLLHVGVVAGFDIPSGVELEFMLEFEPGGEGLPSMAESIEYSRFAA